MTVLYSGCNWNTVVFGMTAGQAEFENWLAEAWNRFEDIVREDPGKYKVTSRRGPGFPNFIVTQSRDPEIYPNELRCRLSTRRIPDFDEPVCTAVIETNGQPVDPKQVWSGSTMIPVFRMGYYKIGDDFGLNLTVLRAEYEPCVRTRIDNHDWIMDVTSKTSGSGSDSVSADETEPLLA